MDELHELLEHIALRLRHTAAITLLETLPTNEARMNLLADVIAPPAALEQASLTAARQELERRLVA